MIVLKSARELAYIRESCRVVARVREELVKAVKPGVSTGELDSQAEDLIIKQGARSSFKGYNGFPASICTSINEEVVHGIPGLRRLETGDIISIDIGAEINGYHGDAAITLPVGEIDQEVQRLLTVTEESLMAGIKQAISGNRLSDISHAVQSTAEKHGFGVVRDYVGHGIGRKMHEEPQVPNFGLPGRGPRLREGMTLAIEPMINMGTHEVYTLADNWTVVTKDNLPSAHFEHTIAITDRGAEILTV
ncbi:MAG: type I methionyl aminopeptidase [Syntrophomonadaceae bacterium]|jgi:methionyl aminopeptidase|nr:type I methionyl aminopeptidase [Syntrophomonadaceae bacterium]